jgi:DNA invertase Pin-like site-specific DNA recombinase
MNQQEKQQEPAVLYVRVSTQEQAREGVSLGAQEARLRAYAALRGLRVVEVVVDAGVSGTTALDKRAGGQRLLEVVAAQQRVGKRQRGPCHVLAVKLDRLFRSTVDALETTRRWADRGVSMHLVDLGGQTVDTSSPMGRFLLTLLAGVAEMERGLIAERTQAALRHKVAQGLQAGGEAPLGFMHEGGRIVEHPRERATRERIRALRARALSLRAIVADLNAHKEQFPPRGEQHHLNTVARIVRGMEQDRSGTA